MSLSSSFGTAATAPSSSSAAAAASAVLEEALGQVRADLLVRSQVQDVIQEMVADVELAHQLQARARDRLSIRSLEEEVARHRGLLEERAALDGERRRRDEGLADRLVVELWSLSEQVGELKKVKAEHQRLLMQHDEVVAQLLQAQEDLAEARERASAGPATTATSSSRPDGGAQRGAAEAGSSPPPSAGTREASIISSGEEKQRQPKASAPAEAEDTARPVTAESQQDSQPKPVISDEAASDGVTASRSEAPAEDSAALPEGEKGAAVSLLEEEAEPDGVPRLEELDETILMRVFSFLDALDILNTAQVNISMYSRVDALFFGGGHEPGAADAADSATVASTEETAPTVPTTVSPPAASQSNPPAVASVSASTAKSPSASASAPAPSPTVVKLPPPSTPSKAPAPASAAPTTPAGSTPASAGVASPSRAAAAATSLFSSILQPRLPAKPGGAPAAASAAPPGSAAAAGLAVPHRRTASADAAPPQQQQHHHQPMNAAMANSMAAKLSDAELNAIIVMTERLKSREQVAERLRAENAELRARLDGAETLEQYLAEKVRELEASASGTEEQDAKTALQIASDQEVIAFLDAKVQELEAEAARRSAELQEGAEEREKTKSGLEQKAKVLSDMLQFERERAKENEVEWRAARKVLVKEVRSLRAQLAALAAERDGYREQNEQLRRAVVAPFSSSPPSRVRQGSFS